MHLAGDFGDLETPSWICETQVSVLVSVVDLHGWTAYSFEDTYHKKHARSLDWSSFYSLDALASGILDSTRILDPRMYFLRVFAIRIDQAYIEWRLVVDILERNVKG